MLTVSTKAEKPLSFRVSINTAKRLDKLVKETGRSKSFYIAEAVNEYLDDLEDYYLADKAWENYKAGKDGANTLEEVMKQYGLEPRHS